VYFDYSGGHDQCEGWGAVIDHPGEALLTLGGQMPCGQGEIGALRCTLGKLAALGIRSAQLYTDHVDLNRDCSLTLPDGMVLLHISRNDPKHKRAHHQAQLSRSMPALPPTLSAPPNRVNQTALEKDDLIAVFEHARMNTPHQADIRRSPSETDQDDLMAILERARINTPRQHKIRRPLSDVQPPHPRNASQPKPPQQHPDPLASPDPVLSTDPDTLTEQISIQQPRSVGTAAPAAPRAAKVSQGRHRPLNMTWKTQHPCGKTAARHTLKLWNTKKRQQTYVIPKGGCPNETHLRVLLKRLNIPKPLHAELLLELTAQLRRWEQQRPSKRRMFTTRPA